jgi:hypothetical protein
MFNVSPPEAKVMLAGASDCTFLEEAGDGWPAVPEFSQFFFARKLVAA